MTACFAVTAQDSCLQYARIGSSCLGCSILHSTGRAVTTLVLLLPLPLLTLHVQEPVGVLGQIRQEVAAVSAQPDLTARATNALKAALLQQLQSGTPVAQQLAVLALTPKTRSSCSQKTACIDACMSCVLQRHAIAACCRYCCVTR